MEIISCHALRHCYVVDFRGVKRLSSKVSKFPIIRGRRLFYFKFESRSSASSRYNGLDSLRLERLHQRRTSGSVCCRDNYEHVGSSVISETLNSYVVDGEEGGSSVSVTNSGQSIPKVSIPSLPDEENGDNVASISSRFWEWKPKLVVHYETSGSENTDSPPVLFLPGFGVGSFHYEKQLKDLGRDYRAWALDFLGQGMSLPVEDPTLQSQYRDEGSLDGETDVWRFGDESKTWAKELVFSVDLWRDQVRCFVEEVIKEPVYLVGNSLGGFVAVYFAACHPELVKGVTLLNATPFWGFLPNRKTSPRLSQLFPWAGTFPLPSILRKKISDPRSVTEILKQVYADHTTKVDQVYSRIIETTQHPAAAASFASIIFAPQGQLSFEEALERLVQYKPELQNMYVIFACLTSVADDCRCRMNNTPICLMYGKDDPWVRPVWGLQVKRLVPDAPYYEMSPAGHCPHDEVPEVVNFLLRCWMEKLESDGSVMLPLVDGDTRELEFRREGCRRSVRVQSHAPNFSVWNWLNSQVEALFIRNTR